MKPVSDMLDIYGREVFIAKNGGWGVNIGEVCASQLTRAADVPTAPDRRVK